MSIPEQRKIVIKLPTLHWRFFFTFRFFLVLFALLACSAFAYWYQNIRPYLWIPSAHLEAFSTVVHSDTAGRLVKMGPQEGDFVKQGQTLLILDQDLIFAKQAQVQRSIETLHTQIEGEKERIGKAMESYVAATTQFELGIGTQDQVKRQLALMDEAQEKTERALSEIGALKSELGLLDLELKKMVLVAPFEGVILKKAKNLGAVVAFGEPLYTLCDPNRIWVEAEIPEQEISHIAIGTPARIRLAAYPKKEWTGKVTYIGPATVAKSAMLPFSGNRQTIPIKISLENTSGLFKPGLSAQVGLKVR